MSRVSAEWISRLSFMLMRWRFDLRLAPNLILWSELRWQADRAERRPLGTNSGEAVPTVLIPLHSKARHFGGSQ